MRRAKTQRIRQPFRQLCKLRHRHYLSSDRQDGHFGKNAEFVNFVGFRVVDIRIHHDDTAARRRAVEEAMSDE
jgi:hypothetical protein